MTIYQMECQEICFDETTQHTTHKTQNKTQHTAVQFFLSLKVNSCLVTYDVSDERCIPPIPSTWHELRLSDAEVMFTPLSPPTPTYSRLACAVAVGA